MHKFVCGGQATDRRVGRATHRTERARATKCCDHCNRGVRGGRCAVLHGVNGATGTYKL